MMGILLDENEQDLSAIFCVRDRDGRTAMKLGLLATLYFTQQGTRAVREAVASVAEDYIQRFHDHLRWAQQPTTARMYPIDSGRVKSPGDWLPSHQDGKSWFFGFHGGDSDSAASDFQVSGYGSEGIEKGMGFFQVYLPLLWFADHQGTFPEFVLNLCERIRPLSGYGGIGVLEPLDISSRIEFQPLVRQLAERFPGLEIEERVGHRIHLRDGIKGVNWLTILGAKWVDAAGGLDYLRIRLDDNFTIYRYDGGLMIQAGSKPQLGDATVNRWPRHYVALAKILKKIQIRNHYPFHFGGPGSRMDKEASMAWLFRFDGK